MSEDISRLVDGAPLKATHDQKVSNDELAAGKEVLAGLGESKPEPITDVDKVKAILEIAPDAPKLKGGAPKPLNIREQHVSPDFDPNVDVYIQDTAQQLQAQASDMEAYFHSPTFKRLQQENPLAARAEMQNAQAMGTEFTTKRNKLNAMAYHQQEAKLKKETLAAIPAWNDKKTQEKEMPELLAYFEARGVNAEQIRKRALQGDTAQMYAQFKTRDMRPKKLRRTGRANDVSRALRILTGEN